MAASATRALLLDVADKHLVAKAYSQALHDRFARNIDLLRRLNMQPMWEGIHARVDGALPEADNVRTSTGIVSISELLANGSEMTRIRRRGLFRYALE